MCGVAGIYAPGRANSSVARVESMVDTLQHRGPDDRGIFIDSDIVMGHDRLSILDLSEAAAQPMVSSDDRWVLSYNGEIFNFQALRRYLDTPPEALGSTGDTVVLLEHIAEYGVTETLRRVEGDWALAVWDRRERRLVLARDLHGVKPLYYRIDGSTVTFASEMKAVLAGREQVDSATVYASLLGLSGTWGDRTFFSDIRAVRPGECVEFRSGEPSHPNRTVLRDVTSFANQDLATALAAVPEERLLDRLEQAFVDSNRLRMISDAPLACLVSGGVDSNLVATLAARENSELQLFHADVVNNSERAAAEALARSLRADLHVTTITDQGFLDNVAAVTHANEIPLTYHPNSVPFYLVSKLAHNHGIKVLLTGEGADEFFLGYPQYALLGLLDRLERSKNVLRSILAKVSPRATKLFWPDTSEQHSEQLRKLVFRYEQQDVRARSARALGGLDDEQVPLELLLSLDLAQPHLVSLLHRNDRLGMAWSLESRFPFLGYEFNRLAVNMPPRYKLRRVSRLHDRRHPFTVDKWAIRQIANRHMPAKLAQRQKQGFPVSVYQRIEIKSGLFQEGFVREQFGLTDTAVELMLTESPSLWRARLLFLEVWGRVLALGQSVEDTQTHVSRHVRVVAS